MRMKGIKAVLEGGWARGQVRGVPPHPLASVDAGCHPHITWVVASHLLSQLLIWSNLLPLQVSKRIREVRPQRPEHRTLPEVSPSKQPPLSPPCPPRASSPCTVHPRVCEAELTQGRVRPRAPQGCESHAGRWLFLHSPHQSES